MLPLKRVAAVACVFLAASAVCFSKASGAERIPKSAGFVVQGGITIEVDANAGTSLASMHERYERNFPSGSRVYYIDQYVVQDGNLAALYPIESQFRLDRFGLHVTNLQSSQTALYSARATIIREMNVSEKVVLPGEKPDPNLERGILIGAARLAKVLSSNVHPFHVTPN